MTSNIGSHIIQENLEKVNNANREDIFNNTRRQVFDLLKKSIRPEFLNRVDEIIMFQPLTKEEIRQVVRLQLNLIAKMLEKNDIRLDATDKAIDYIASIGFDPQYGARPIKRVLQKQVLNELSRMLLQGKVDRNSLIEVNVKDGHLVFTNTPDS